MCFCRMPSWCSTVMTLTSSHPGAWHSKPQGGRGGGGGEGERYFLSRGKRVWGENGVSGRRGVYYYYCYYCYYYYYCYYFWCSDEDKHTKLMIQRGDVKQLGIFCFMLPATNDL